MKKYHIKTFAISIAASVCSAIFALLMSRGERLLGHDGFYYLSLAEIFSKELPRHIGNYYAFGYPALSSVFIRIGVDPFLSCVAISWLSWLFLCWAYCTIANCYPDDQKLELKLLVLFVMASAVGIFLMSTGVMSEMLFAALICCQILLLSKPLHGWPLLAVMVFPVLIFSTRYAGIFMIPALFFWLLRSYANERNSRNLIVGTLGLIVAGAINTALIYQNYLVTGHWTGGTRDIGAHNIYDIIVHSANLGWSFPAIFIGNAIEFAKFSDYFYIIGGAAVFFLIIAYCFIIYLKPGNASVVTACAATVITYLLSMVVLRSISSFDGLQSSRFALPVIVPLAVLATIELKNVNRRIAYAVSLLLIGLGSFQVVRGISAQTYSEIDGAVKIIESLQKPNGRILAAGQAARIAAYIGNDVVMAHTPPENFDDTPFEYLLMTSIATDRQGQLRAFDQEWRDFANRLVEEGILRFEEKNENGSI